MQLFKKIIFFHKWGQILIFAIKYACGPKLNSFYLYRSHLSVTLENLLNEQMEMRRPAQRVLVSPLQMWGRRRSWCWKVAEVHEGAHSCPPRGAAPVGSRSDTDPLDLDWRQSSARLPLMMACWHYQLRWTVGMRRVNTQTLVSSSHNHRKHQYFSRKFTLDLECDISLWMSFLKFSEQTFMAQSSESIQTRPFNLEMFCKRGL